MPVVIDLQGEIGWEIWPEEVKAKLKAAGKEDIIVRWSTIGGSVFDGSDIMSLFIDHKRDNPAVSMKLEIKAIAASMGSAMAALSVWDEVVINRTTSFMIHNPSDFSWGDFRDMEASAKFLKDMRDVYSSLYSDRSKKSQSEIDTLMDAETWFFGDEIVNNGFADRVIDENEPGGEPLPEDEKENRKTLIFLEMKNKRKEMKRRIKEVGEDEHFDRSKAAACLKMISPIVEPELIIETPGEPDDIKPASVGNLRMEVPMNEEELKKDNLELYKSIMKKGADSERDGNDERVKTLTLMKANEDYKGMPEVIEVIDNCIADNTTAEGANPLIMAAMMKIMKDPARMAALESPGDIGSGDPADPAPGKPKMKVREV